jgi:uncharacterized protein with GYD domain
VAGSFAEEQGDKGGCIMARAIVLLKLTREGAMSIEQARAIYEETKIFFAQTDYKIVDLYATLGEYDFVSIIEVPDQNAIKHLFRRGVLAAGRGTFQVCTLPALPFEEFLGVVDDLRPAEEPSRP